MLRNIKIIGSGIGLPARQVFHEDFDQTFQVQNSLSVTGIESRFMATDETASQLGAIAAVEALKNAKLNWSEIDCLVAASATMDKALPYNAAMLHAELGLDHRRTATFDVGASCLSFFAALDVVSYMIEAGRFRIVMIVSSDISSFALDFANLKENGIFGDGAAAVVVTKTPSNESSKIIFSKMATVSKGVDFCEINNVGSRYHQRNRPDMSQTFKMKGRSVFSLVMREFPEFIRSMLDQSGLHETQIKLYVPHQGSLTAMRHFFSALEVVDERWINIFPQFGNQVGASLPTALHQAIKKNKITRGDHVFLLGTGAGLTLGGLIMEY